MKTHENRALFSQALLKATTCLFLATGSGLYALPALAEPTTDVESAIVQQAVTIKGIVKDKTGEPIIGANVLEKGTTNGVITGIDGDFTLNVKNSQSVLVISFIGYKTQEITVGNNRNLNVTLADDTELLDEVVVIGYGTQKKGDVTSAVASVKSEDFIKGAVGDAAELVKGKVAGLNITKGSGDPNASSTIRLRGVISLEGSATPLILVDGIEGSLTTVPPEDIASIDVLKDASAAAIYGTRGANGVILITTKSGKRDEKAQATYSGYVSLSNFSNRLDFMTADQVRQGLTSFTDRGYDTDWLEAVTRTAFTHNHDFQISGGSKTTTYSGSVSYKKAEGVIIDTFNEELKMNFDVSHYMLNDILKVHLNMVKGTHKNSAIGLSEDDGDAGIYLQALMRNPTEPIYNEDGTFYENFGINYYYNPVGMIKEKSGEYKGEWTRMTGDITVEPIKGWQTKLMLATRRSNYHDQGYYSSEYYSQKSQYRTGYAYQSYDGSRTDELELTSRYSKTWQNKHRFEAMLGYSHQNNVNEGFSGNNYNFANDFFQYNNLGMGTALKEGKAGLSSYKNENTLIGFFGRISYGYDNRYNILVSMRREGSSKFGDNHKWGSFPSVSLGWNVMNEKFMESTRDWLSNLKLRAGFGITGVIPGDSYQSLTRYNLGSSYYYEDGEWKQSLVVASNPNPDLKWETSKEWNFGVDFGFFDDRLTGSIDVYRKNTSDMLWWYDVPTPPNLYGRTLANVGEMRNQGIEVLVSGIPVRTKDFEWTTTITASHNANKLLSLSNDLYETANQHDEGGLGQPISLATHRLEVGKAIGQYYGLKSVGVSENGLWMVENKVTGEVVELQDDMLTNDDYKHYLGTGLPKVYMGWANTFRYKNFDLSMQFTGQFGFKVLNEARAFWENNSITFNRLQSVLDAPYGGQYTLASNQKQTFVSYYLENGDFVKLTNLTFGYNVPLKENHWIKSARAYVSGENLFTITGYSGLNPELDNANATAAGIERRSKYPATRSFTFGLNLTF
ncbi:MAG: TonB-dependent receptor [Mediterranea sp.]|nr:TonB-dependent receptor [Mediterranea sp.]